MAEGALAVRILTPQRRRRLHPGRHDVQQGGVCSRLVGLRTRSRVHTNRRSRDVSVAELAAQIRMTAACMTGSLLASLIFRLKNAPGDAVSVGR